MVAGVLALLQSFLKKSGYHPTHTVIMQMIHERSVDLGVNGLDEQFGSGLANIFNFIKG